MTDDAKRQQDLERIRRQRERLDAIGEQLDATEPATPPEAGRRPRRLRGVLVLLALVIGPILLAQVASTIGSYSGYDYADARRTGRATVVSCDRRGPVGVLQLGYWDDCTVDIRWDDGTSFRGKLGRPHLFRASEAGSTVEIGDNGRGRFSQKYSRPDFPPKPALRTLSTVLILIDVLPLVALLFAVWTGVKMLVTRRR